MIESYKYISEQNTSDSQKTKDILFRLLTRPEMESVWKWVNEQDMILPIMANGGMVGKFINALHRFEQTAKYPASDV